MIATHEVIIRHMRFRGGTKNVAYARDDNTNEILYYQTAHVGENVWSSGKVKEDCIGTIVAPSYNSQTTISPCPLGAGVDPETIHSLLIIGTGWDYGNGTYNVIIDHCSASWGVDETLAITGGVMDTTVQWSIVSEGLMQAGHSKGQHSKGLMISGKALGGRHDNAITLHHNYIAHNEDRSPMMMSPYDTATVTRIDGFNNVSYNWHHGLGPWIEETPQVNWEENYAKLGPRSTSARPVQYNPKPQQNITGTPLIYLYHNIGTSGTNPGNPQWNIGYSFSDTLLTEAFQKTNSYSTSTVPVTVTAMTQDYATTVVMGTGATVPIRDSVDTRVITDYVNGTAPNPNTRDAGNLVLNVEWPTDYPVFNSPAPPIDTDNDGMPDAWETANGLNPADATDRNDIVLVGQSQRYASYTNLEYYLGELADGGIVANDVTAPGIPGGVSVN
jgi:hypothetical protein